jgi:hypothetical protein
MMKVLPVSLDEIANDPRRLADLPMAVVRDLYLRADRVKAEALVRMLVEHHAEPPALKTPPSAEDFITLKDAARLIGVSVRWFRRRRFSFVKRLSARRVVVSRSGLQKWIASRDGLTA